MNLEKARKEGLVDANSDGVSLTPAGVERIDAARRLGDSTESDVWIAPDEACVIDQSDHWEVYLPPKSWRAD